MTNPWNTLAWVLVTISGLVAIYFWHNWVVENDRKVVAYLERERCMPGVVVNHVCYLPNRSHK